MRFEADSGVVGDFFWSLTLFSVASTTKQQASTGTTPLSDSEPDVSALELSAQRLWLGEIPGS